MRPLAERMRPQFLSEYVGQEHLTGEGGALTQWVKSGNIPSMIFWGPPGVGKTSLAKLLANETKLPFIALSAVESGVKDVREAIKKAQSMRFFESGNPILFIDEIHRFSKSQQDALLGAVEQGIVTLVGATTENPSFEVISALLSRCQVYILDPLSGSDLRKLYEKAVKEDEYLNDFQIDLKEDSALFSLSGGDARKMYNILEMITLGRSKGDKISVTDELIEKVVQQNLARFDKGGEVHYDIASAMIKSIRGSDPNASVYWLARMIAGGEEVRFIARRLLISASEDIGMANPNALLLATSAMHAVDMVGLPEARIILSQVAIYLASSPKSNSAYLAIDDALEKVRVTGDQPVPLHLRNAPTRLMKELGYGEDYKYAHDFTGNFIDQEYLPADLSGSAFYKTGANEAENKIATRLKALWKAKYNF